MEQISPLIIGIDAYSPYQRSTEKQMMLKEKNQFSETISQEITKMGNNREVIRSGNLNSSTGKSG